MQQTDSQIHQNKKLVERFLLKIEVVKGTKA